MTDVLVCVKRVPDSTSEVVLTEVRTTCTPSPTSSA